MPYLSQTFESYQRVKIYTYSVNDWFKEFFTVIWNLQAFLQFADRTLCPKIAFYAFSAIVFYIFLQLIILFI